MIGQMDLTGIYRVFHPAAAQYTFLSAAYGSFFKMDHILDHKASLIKCKKIERTPCILPDYNGVKLIHNRKRNYRRYSNP
jgi:hypothetical protein